MRKPLVVFAGRSNVGKSSTIRALTGKKVRIGKKPGSTRWEFMIDLGAVTLVDIPGFGYMAGISKTDIEEMKITIIRKLEDWSDDLVLGVLIIDVSLFRQLVTRWEKRDEIPIDIEFYTFLSEIASKVVVVANKVDKLKRKEKLSEIEYLRVKLLEALPEKQPIIVPVSAAKKTGIMELRTAIERVLSEEGLYDLYW
ncbi:MAG: GTP-binding protein EngB [Candidatus Hodarchaeota archaeon]